MREPGLRATTLAVPAEEPQSVPRRQRGIIDQIRLGREGARQEFVTFQVGEAQTGRRQCSDPDAFRSRIRN